jgi:ribose-phosphate pyrophosphokinase
MKTVGLKRFISIINPIAMSYGDIKIFSGNSNKPLAEKICEHLSAPLGKASIEKFKNGEIKVQILENARGKDVFVVQSGARPINDNLMELLGSPC